MQLNGRASANVPEALGSAPSPYHQIIQDNNLNAEGSQPGMRQ